MNDVTRILSALEHGDQQAADRLLPLVYEELRRLAAQKLAHETPGQTLQPTALVHEAYVRLVANGNGTEPRDQLWDGRGHFFAAAAEAMRRILVDNARRKKRGKHGGHLQRQALEDHDILVETPPEEILALDAALPRLAATDPVAAQVVQLHFFAGVPIEQIAQQLGMSRATAYRQWSYARAWLRAAIDEENDAAGL